MKCHGDESEDAPSDDAEDPRNNVQRSRSNGDSTASHDDEGASSSQGTQDVEQDYQGVPEHSNSNEQLVEPSGQDEDNPAGAPEEVREAGRAAGGAAGAAGGTFDLGVLEELKDTNPLVLFPQVTEDPLLPMIMGMVGALVNGHMLAERD